ncbi:MAG TPA: peptidylprolyl isomerase [Allosphingosinicella sp.]|jgi:peptidyl-prolyl cis-trans isomerase A (cyclophilin A)
MLKRLLFAILLVLAGPAVAQTVPSAPAAPVRVALVTSAGRVVLELDTVHAPVTAGNFLRYVDARRLDGTEFYRAMRLGPGGLVQGGVRDPRRLFPAIAHEPTSQTGLSHVDGAISMAQLDPGTAQMDFFIMVGAQPGFDAARMAAGAQPSSAELGFAVFGRVVEGMDVVRQVLAAPTSPTEGEGVMRGQMLSPRIRILTARRMP